MKLLSIIEATKVQEGSNDSYYAYHNAAEKWAKDTGQPKEKFAYAGTDVQDEYIEPEMKKYGLVPDSYQGKGVTKYRRENVEEKAPSDAVYGIFADGKDITARYASLKDAKEAAEQLQQNNPKVKYEVKKADPDHIEEGEERSIIHDGCVDKLVDEFRGEEHQFENMGDLEYAIYSELERLDVEDCVDPDMEHGGQRIGDFASGGVLNVIDSSSVIDDVVAQLDVSELEEGITTKHSYDPVKPGGQSKPTKRVPVQGQMIDLDGVQFMVTHVSDDRKTFDVVNANDPKEKHKGIKVERNPFFIENLDYLDKSKYKDMPMKLELQRVLAQMLGIDNYYKMDVEDLEQELKRNPANSTLWNEYSAYKKKLQIQKDDKISPTIGNFASDNRDPRFREGKSPHKKGSAKYKKHMAAMHAESEEEGRWAIYIDGKDAQVRFKDYVDAGEMEDKMKKKHPSKKIELKKVGLNEVSDKDADQIIKQIISAYGIDRLEQVFREYFPRLSDEQVDKFLKDYRRSQLKVVKNEDVDLNDGMIGEPDTYYDEEERKEAFSELQDALDRCNRHEAEYVKDGICPNCAGTGYQDAEDEVYNDETDEYEEGNECDGWSNYGCDEGEMQGATWKEIMDHDKRNADRRKSKEEYPGDEEVINQIRNMVMGMEDPRMAMQQMAIDYPHMGRAQRASLVAKGMKAAGLTNEGQRCWKGYEKKGTKMMFGKRVNNCVKKEGVEMNEKAQVEKIKSPSTGKTIEFIVLNGQPFDKSGGKLPYPDFYDIMLAYNYGSDIAINTAYKDYVDMNMNVKGYNPGHPMKDSIQVGDELMIETADGEGIVVPVLHVVGENILVGWDQLAEDIFTEQDTQLAELRKLAGIEEAEYRGRKVKLNKPTRGDVKKFKVYVKDPKTGNIKKVNFGHGGSSAKKAGQKTMKIRKSNPKARKSFRARHNCDNPGPKTKARYWSCRKW